MPLKIRTHQGDGAASAATFDVVILHPTTGEPMEDVVITCRAVSKARVREIHQSFQERVPEPTMRSMVMRYKPNGLDDAMDAALGEAVVSWRGIVGADDRPLVCTPATVAALDDRTKAQLVMAVFGAEVVDQASFREPADVLPLVAVRGES